MTVRGHQTQVAITDRGHGFGALLAEVRLRRKFLQKQVAIDAHVDPSYLAALERGRRRPPPRPTLDRLIRALCATEEEQTSIRRYAAIGRIELAIRANASDLQDAQWIARILQMAPIIGYEGQQAVDAVVLAIANHERHIHSVEASL